MAGLSIGIAHLEPQLKALICVILAVQSSSTVFALHLKRDYVLKYAPKQCNLLIVLHANGTLVSNHYQPSIRVSKLKAYSPSFFSTQFSLSTLDKSHSCILFIVTCPLSLQHPVSMVGFGVSKPYKYM